MSKDKQKSLKKKTQQKHAWRDKSAEEKIKKKT